ncbi:hypothetical protein SAMN05444287_0778 [Octadecabacter temperatus]|uniref:Uncharacterized protein n=1 Tax=Octadecabacter temperatus TaxID=1458307 RepID=A0A0K0Y421_9RHOB|nr:hypothetical protein [Octadecabacter temperatus]AKS45680.1 hypothetical protein OSB_11240 [Octadecabacter temperatus]SIN98213.1 hypothetical protein SAMN05444287_0778 [Octadecabacter temperatus]
MKLRAVFAVTIGSILPLQVNAQDVQRDIFEYAKCIGQTDGYHVAAEPYAEGTFLLDLHLKDVAVLQSASTPEQWANFQVNRALGLSEWEARIAVLQTIPMEQSPLWTEHASIAWECGQQRQRLVAAGVFEH